MLAMQAANSTDPKVYKDKVMEIANGPGRRFGHQDPPANWARRWS
jgi:branched-chain amino acid transport system substrate-binding protein